MSEKKAVFIDRDGTIIYDRSYLKDPDGVELLPNVVEGLQMLQKHGFLLVVVTNQSGIARGFFGEEELRKVNDKMYELLKENGVLLSGVYYCPHYENGIPGSPYATVCTCRKPKPGMAFKAKEDLKLSLGASYMIGDKPADIAFGKNAGCRASILLHGEKNDENPDGLQADYDYLAQNMLLAAQWIIRNEKEGVL